MIRHAIIPIELRSGGLLEIDIEVQLTWCRAGGDNWNSPRIEAHWEEDGFRVTAATWHHADGDQTTIKTPRGSIAEEWLRRFLDRQLQLIEEALGAMVLE